MMIECCIFKNKEKFIVGFELKGHADYADKGYDIICASTSVLVINTINAIEKFGKDECIVDQDEKTGTIFFKLTNHISEQTRVLLNALELGLLDICKTYGSKYLNVSYKEV